MNKETKICKICGKELAKNAKICPNCGQDQRNFFSRHKILTGIGIIVILGVIGSFGSSPNNLAETKKTTQVTQEANKEVKEAKTEENTTPEITISSAELIKAYADNEVGADQKYKGKIAKISGIVEGIDSGINDEAIVKLSDGTDFSIVDVHCYIKPSDKEKAAKLAKGQNVTMVGRLDGEVIGYPSVKDCTIK